MHTIFPQHTCWQGACVVLCLCCVVLRCVVLCCVVLCCVVLCCVVLCCVVLCLLCCVVLESFGVTDPWHVQGQDPGCALVQQTQKTRQIPRGLDPLSLHHRHLTQCQPPSTMCLFCAPVCRSGLTRRASGLCSPGKICNPWSMAVMTRCGFSAPHGVRCASKGDGQRPLDC